VKRVLAEGAYDSRAERTSPFSPSDNKIKPVIRVREKKLCPQAKSRGCLSRKKAVIEQEQETFKPKSFVEQNPRVRLQTDGGLKEPSHASKASSENTTQQRSSSRWRKKWL
jgi:fatty acid-binding protein DegV